MAKALNISTTPLLRRAQLPYRCRAYCPSHKEASINLYNEPRDCITGSMDAPKCQICGDRHYGPCWSPKTRARKSVQQPVVALSNAPLGGANAAPAPKPVQAAAPVERKGRPRRRKTAKASRTKGKKPVPMPAPSAAPANPVKAARFYAPPGDCAFCDERRTYSAQAMRNHRAASK